LHAFVEAGYAPLLGPVDAAQARRLGAPLYPARLQIVGSHGAPCAVGIPGQLQVGTALPVSPQAAGSAGYLALDQRARFLADGNVELITADALTVNVLGHRVSLEEIGNVLARHPSVASALVRVAKRKVGPGQLVAFFLAKAGSNYTESELRKHLRQSLPEHALPRAFVEIDALPFDDSGAIDEARLMLSFLRDDDDFVAPSSEAEKLLAKLWTQELGLTRISAHDNFFDVGGHSLLCFKVIARLEQETGKRLSPRVFLSSSLAQVALELDGVRPAPAALPEARSPAPERAPDSRQGGGLFQKLKGLIGRD
jgi:hypothetical protein